MPRGAPWRSRPRGQSNGHGGAREWSPFTLAAPGSSRSRGAAVALEQPSQPLVDRDIDGHVRRRSIAERLVPYALVRTLGVVLRDVLVDGPSQRILAEEDHSAQALALDRLHEAFGVGVAVGCSGGCADDADPNLFKEFPEPRAELPVPVADEGALAEQETVEAVGEVLGDADHPGFVAVGSEYDQRRAPSGS